MAVLAVIVCALSGCIRGDLILIVGKWASAAGTVDFRPARFDTRTVLSFGEIRIEGRYSTNTETLPKEIDFAPEKVYYRFSVGDKEFSETFRSGLPWERADAVFQKGMALVQSPADVAAMCKLRTHLEALAAEKPVEGIYEIEVNYGTYLRYSYNRPGDGRPWDFGAGYVVEEY